ncbi:MAG: TIGR02391 family protein [Desulfofustis sp.]|nr:TIGR02391 family protein [Desulfofustis sp.]
MVPTFYPLATDSFPDILICYRVFGLEHPIQKLDQIIGRLQSIEQEDEILEDPTQPIRPGVGVDYLILGYLSHLHPFISGGCSQLFIDGHYAQAVEEAAKAVFQYIRNKTGLSGDGANLAQNAFSLKSPTLAFSDLSDENKQNEQIGFMEMLKGFAKGVRNPLAHTHGRQEEVQKAFEYLVFASLLCRRIDDASPEVEK